MHSELASTLSTPSEGISVFVTPDPGSRTLGSGVAENKDEKIIRVKLPKHSKVFCFDKPTSESVAEDILSALQIDLNQAQEALLKNQDKQSHEQRNKRLRDLAGCEIHQLFITDQLPATMRDAEFAHIHAIYNKSIEEKTTLPERIRAEFQVLEYCESKEIFKKFIKHCLGSANWVPNLSRDKSMVYPTSSIDAIAEALDTAVFVWKMDPQDQSKMLPDFSYVPNRTQRVKHLLRTADPKKFIRLNENQAATLQIPTPTHHPERKVKNIPGEGIDAHGGEYYEIAMSNSQVMGFRPVSEEAGASLEAKNPEDNEKLCAPKGMSTKPKSASNKAIKGKIPIAADLSKIMDHAPTIEEQQHAVEKWQKIINDGLAKGAAQISKAEKEFKELTDRIAAGNQDERYKLLEKLEEYNNEQCLEKFEDKDDKGRQIYYFRDAEGNPVKNSDGDFVMVVADDKNGWLTYEKPNYKIYDKPYIKPAKHTSEKFELLGCREWKYDAKTNKITPRKLWLTSDHDELGSATERQFPMLINADGITIGGDIYVMPQMPENLKGYRGCYIFTSNPPALHHIRKGMPQSFSIDARALESLTKGLVNYNQRVPLQHFLSKEKLEKFKAIIDRADPEFSRTSGKEKFTQQDYQELCLAGKIQELATIIAEYEIQMRKEYRNRIFVPKLGFVNDLEEAAKIYLRSATCRMTNHGAQVGNPRNEPLEGIHRFYRFISAKNQGASSSFKEIFSPHMESPAETDARAPTGQHEIGQYIDGLWQEGIPFPVHPHDNWERHNEHLRVAPVKYDWNHIYHELDNLKNQKERLVQDKNAHQDNYNHALQQIRSHLSTLENEIKGDQEFREIKDKINSQSPSVILEGLNKLELLNPEVPELKRLAKNAKNNFDEIRKIDEDLLFPIDTQIALQQLIMDLRTAQERIKLEAPLIYSNSKNTCLDRVFLTKDPITGLRRARRSNHYLDSHPRNRTFWGYENIEIRPRVIAEEMAYIDEWCKAEVEAIQQQMDELIMACKGEYGTCYVAESNDRFDLELGDYRAKQDRTQQLIFAGGHTPLFGSPIPTFRVVAGSNPGSGGTSAETSPFASPIPPLHRFIGSQRDGAVHERLLGGEVEMRQVGVSDDPSSDVPNSDTPDTNCLTKCCVIS